MPKINVLDKHVAELIAAGEVVERPCSVIKELVENAVDAGATALTVEIKNGGVSYMRVTDNGCGISRPDVPLAFLRHATSKVRGQDDLDAIATLGFRGEALASVAAVARVELLTRTQEDLAGTRYVIAGGDEVENTDAGCAQGTTIVVRDLFYNTPARMKFLKKDVTEANAIAGVLDRLALSHPEVSVRFMREGKETLHTPGDGRLKSAVYAVFGKEFTNGLIPVNYELDGIAVSGFISRPAAARPNRSMQFFFINGRYVKSRTMMAALEESFKGSLMVGKVPACVLHLTVSYGTVDVNVHPSKIEVRFLNEKPIFEAVYHGSKSALNQGDEPSMLQLPQKPAPAAPFIRQPETVQTRLSAAQPGEKKAYPRGFSDSEAPMFYHGNTENSSKEDGFSAKVVKTSAIRQIPASPLEKEWMDDADTPPGMEGLADEELEKKAAPPAHVMQDKPEIPQEPGKTAEEESPPVRLVGEIFGTYILLERGDEMIVIDKHAAHERMLYEQLKSETGEADRQLLLSPVTVTLEKNEYAAVLEALPLCEQAGFEIEDFGSGAILIRSVPLILADDDIAAAVMEIAGYLQSAKNDLTTEKLDWLYHNVACRAAIKAGDESSPQEMLALAERLANHPEIRYCPHGRPVSYRLKKRELEKQFGRV